MAMQGPDIADLFRSQEISGVEAKKAKVADTRIRLDVSETV